MIEAAITIFRDAVTFSRTGGTSQKVKKIPDLVRTFIKKLVPKHKGRSSKHPSETKARSKEQASSQEPATSDDEVELLVLFAEAAKSRVRSVAKSTAPLKRHQNRPATVEPDARLGKNHNRPATLEPGAGLGEGHNRPATVEPDARLGKTHNRPATLEPGAGLGEGHNRPATVEPDARLGKTYNRPATLEPGAGLGEGHNRPTTVEPEVRLGKTHNRPATLEPGTRIWENCDWPATRKTHNPSATLEPGTRLWENCDWPVTRKTHNRLATVEPDARLPLSDISRVHTPPYIRRPIVSGVGFPQSCMLNRYLTSTRLALPPVVGNYWKLLCKYRHHQQRQLKSRRRRERQLATFTILDSMPPQAMASTIWASYSSTSSQTCLMGGSFTNPTSPRTPSRLCQELKVNSKATGLTIHTHVPRIGRPYQTSTCVHTSGPHIHGSKQGPDPTDLLGYHPDATLRAPKGKSERKARVINEYWQRMKLVNVYVQG